jgi:hypothetical protein
VVSVHLKDDGSDIPISAPSMGSLVHWSLQLFDLGICTYDREASRMAATPTLYLRTTTTVSPEHAGRRAIAIA